MLLTKLAEISVHPPSQIVFSTAIKVEISASAIDYKSHYINNFLYSWTIRGPDLELSSKAMSVDDLPCVIVDIMYDGINDVIGKAEDDLGKV